MAHQIQAETIAASTYAGHLTNGDPTKAAASYKPTHPGLFEVQFRDGEYNSCLVALRVREVLWYSETQMLTLSLSFSRTLPKERQLLS